MQKLLASVVYLAAAAALATAGGEKSGKIEGQWKAVSATSRGTKVPQEQIDKAMVMLVFKDGKYTVTIGGKELDAGTYKTDTTKKPHTIDLIAGKGKKTDIGIYKIEGDTLTLAMGVASAKDKEALPKPERPTAFDGKGNVELTTFKRAK
jgi:uncharacterized protein (TIGR03067 family)